MELEVISGQPNIDLKEIFINYCAENDIYVYEDKNALFFPERNIFHPKTLYDKIRKEVKEHIENKQDLFILTYSEHVLNAVRVEIKLHKFEGAKCHQYLDNGICITADIDTYGSMSAWVDDIFDVWDNAIMELFS